MDEFKYLFPFEKIPPKSKVLIYGAGELGQLYLKQICITNYCNIVGLLDRNYKCYDDSTTVFFAPEKVGNIDFDYVVIAVKSKTSLSEMYRVLDEAGIPHKKIIYVGTRKNEKKIFLHYGSGQDKIKKQAHDDTKIDLAFYILSGIGGLLFIKRYIIELLKDIPECRVDLYAKEHIDAIKFLLSDIENINRVVFSMNNEYLSCSCNYDLSITVIGSGIIAVDAFDENKLGIKAPFFADKIRKLVETLQDEEFTMDTPRIAFFEASKYLQKNAYTVFERGIWDLSDWHVNVPLTKYGYGKYKALNLKQYITFNSANGISAYADKVAKAWPLYYFEETIARFKRKYPNVEVIQVGAVSSVKIASADRFVLGEDLSMVAHILNNAIFHLDIEGGLVHIASQLGTKCIVLFGPTPEYYYGYLNNINIKVGNCHDCCGIYANYNRCARGLKCPPCMYNITPELVMNRIDIVMNSLKE